MLSADEVAGLRDVLNAGKRPRVMFAPSAGQMAGQLGHVVRLEDPAADPEFVVVRFGNDELGFSPADLMIPPKRMPAPRAPVAATEPEPTVAGPPLLPMTAPSKKKTETGTVDVGKTAAAEKNDKASPSRKAARAKAPAELTVTLTCQEGQWSVQASRGAKVISKPVPVRAPDALAMVQLLDVPAIREVVEELVSAARAAAEMEAERLRRELAEVEARLAELPA